MICEEWWASEGKGWWMIPNFGTRGGGSRRSAVMFICIVGAIEDMSMRIL